VPTLEEIRAAFARHEPRLVRPEGRSRAAVAMILRQAGPVPELLLIERARRAGDPWSGHMAFPGGRVDPQDPDLERAAEREALEEVGLDLRRAERLGRLDDMEGHEAAVPRLVISGFVYHLPDPPPLAPNLEVREAFWFPLRELRDPRRQVERRVERADLPSLPGILVGEPGRHVVWGLTYRFLEVFFQVLGSPLPHRAHELPAGRRPAASEPLARSRRSR
jgi:8-oxo-dGTP pyrophosphatase MutT (NUDIX family)